MPKEYELITHTVTAIQLSNENVPTVLDFCGGVEVEEIDCSDSKKRFKGVNVPTLEGVKRASIKPTGGDWIYKRDGSFNVMTNIQFLQTYKKV